VRLVIMGTNWSGGCAMKFSKDEINRARASYCVSQAALAKDEKIKQFWDELANEWLEIDAKVRSGQSNPEQTARWEGGS
jgi:hypothetical protein